MLVRALSSGGGSISPTIGNSSDLSGTLNASSFVYTGNLPSTPKYVCLIAANSNIGGKIIEEWCEGTEYQTYYYSGNHDRTTQSTHLIDVQSNKVGFKGANSGWSDPLFTICY